MDVPSSEFMSPERSSSVADGQDTTPSQSGASPTNSFDSSSPGSSRLSEGLNSPVFGTSPQVNSVPQRRTGIVPESLPTEQIDESPGSHSPEHSAKDTPDSLAEESNGPGAKSFPPREQGAVIHDADATAVPHHPLFWLALVASWQNRPLSIAVVTMLATTMAITSFVPYALFNAWTYAYVFTAFIGARLSLICTSECLDLAASFARRRHPDWSIWAQETSGTLRAVYRMTFPETLHGLSLEDVRAVFEAASTYAWMVQSWTLMAVSLRKPLDTAVLVTALWALAYFQTLLAALLPVASVLLLFALTHGLWQHVLGAAVVQAARDVLPAHYSAGIAAVVVFDYHTFLYGGHPHAA